MGDSKMITTPPAKIKVFGMGGGGSNAVRRMARGKLTGVELYAVNTDAVALAYTATSDDKVTTVQIGPKVTKGMGAGGDIKIGTMAAEESREELRRIVRGADMAFIAAGMGGGTGTGSAPVMADIAREAGALTIAIVTRPFAFEGQHRSEQAEEGIKRLVPVCDTLIAITNDRILGLCDRRTAADHAFKVADDILFRGVSSISSVITTPGEINLDFADVKAVMKDRGQAWLAIGTASGQNKAVAAAKACITSPLLDASVDGATAILFTVTAGLDLTLAEIQEAAEVIRKAADPSANIIFGMNYAPEMSDEIRITLIATGFNARHGKVNKEAMEKEMKELRKRLLNQDQMDIPAFLRNPIQNRRQQIVSRGQSHDTGAATPNEFKTSPSN